MPNAVNKSIFGTTFNFKVIKYAVDSNRGVAIIIGVAMHRCTYPCMIFICMHLEAMNNELYMYTYNTYIHFIIIIATPPGLPTYGSLYTCSYHSYTCMLGFVTLTVRPWHKLLENSPKYIFFFSQIFPLYFSQICLNFFK